MVGNMSIDRFDTVVVAVVACCSLVVGVAVACCNLVVGVAVVLALLKCTQEFVVGFGSA